ncbi:HEAT repeat domain-containing protein [Fimbriiglobus ruber]|uniref:HEAT repeat protein n=1 Tax=Fimbriiglobus ruber TaxID=1908690 RepID=A0A225DX46_9BACT|nr:HEAT repeat domain-containing protein [Fimbriiglobus ruber]OWK41769.1 HEAT repeat protein [Fimbriiglobus ruber]
MEQLSPQLMHKLVFTVLMHGLNDSQTTLALKVLTDALDHDNPQVRELAVVALADLPVPVAKRVHALMIALTDEAPRVRRRAARALGDQGPAAGAAMLMLMNGLRDPDQSVRRDSAGALGRLGPAAHQSTTALITLLADPETRMRVVVSVAIKRIGRAAIPALLNSVRTDDADLRGRCATLLTKIAPDDAEVIAALKDVLTDEEEELRARDDESLQHVNTPLPIQVPRMMRNALPIEV